MNRIGEKTELKARIRDRDIHAVSIIPDTVISDDTVILFLHDALGSVEQWKTFPERLAGEANMKAYVYDRAGHGKSDPAMSARDKNYLHLEAICLRSLIEYLHLKKVILIGHSDGASISLLYASNHDDVGAVVAISPHVFVEDITRNGIRDFKKTYVEKNLSRSLERFHGEKTRKLFDAWHDTWLSPDFSDWNIEDQMRKIQCPVLLIQGLDDEYGSMKQIDSISDRLRRSPSKILIPDCAHFPHVTSRNIVEKGILDFLKTVTEP